MTVRIVDPANFVVNQNRKHENGPRWWACPTRPSRKCQSLIGKHPRGLAIYGFWVLLVGDLSSRSTLWAMVDGDGSPESIEDFAWRYHVPMDLAAESVAELVRIGWLEYLKPCQPLANSEAASEVAPRQPPRHGTVRDVTVRDETVSIATQSQAANAAKERDKENAQKFVDGWNAVVADEGGRVPKVKLVGSLSAKVRSMLRESRDYNSEDPWVPLATAARWFVKQGYTHNDDSYCGAQTFMRPKNFKEYVGIAYGNSNGS